MRRKLRAPLSPSLRTRASPVEAAAADARELNQFEADGKVEGRGEEDREEGDGCDQKGGHRGERMKGRGRGKG